MSSVIWSCVGTVVIILVVMMIATNSGVTNETINKALAFCESNGGLKEIKKPQIIDTYRGYVISSATFICNNEATLNYRSK